MNLENLFISALGNNEKLKWFLKYDINLVEYLDAKSGKYMALADLILAITPKEKVRELTKDITSGRILKILEKERPDLYKTLATKGMPWLERQIENFRKRFL